MDKKDALAIARKYALLIKANYNCKYLFLFGSYVRGNVNEESDIDIAIILNEFKNPIDTRLELMRLRRKIDSRIEPHPIREKDFNITNPIAYEILTHGQRIDTI